MGPTLRRAVVPLCVAVAVVVSPQIATAVPPADLARVERAIGYLASQQRPNGAVPALSPIGSTADAVLSFVAAGIGRRQVRQAIGYLRRQTVKGELSTIGLRAKVVSAFVAAGRDPHDVGGTDLVEALSSTLGPDGHYGDAAVFDQALVILALASAGEEIPADAIGWLVAAQCADGGWQFDLPATATDDEHCVSTADPASDVFESETNATSLVVQAVAAAGATPAFGHDPFAFFAEIRDSSYGGWGYSWSFPATDANSTSLVIQAYAAAERPLPSGVARALRRLQYRSCGAFAFSRDDAGRRTGPDAGATIGAILGLLRVSRPTAGGVLAIPSPTPACVT
jgi:hypothetical protein